MRFVPITLALLCSATALAQIPVCHCRLDQGLISCEGAYKDGSRAEDVAMRVMTYGGETLHSGRLDRQSRFGAPLPDQPFYILMDAGPGEMFEVDWRDIEGLAEQHFRTAAGK
ncbi:MAG: hypothetical protein ACK5HY_17230 [Parahaliea sp.]